MRVRRALHINYCGKCLEGFKHRDFAENKQDFFFFAICVQIEARVFVCAATSYTAHHSIDDASTPHCVSTLPRDRPRGGEGMTLTKKQKIGIGLIALCVFLLAGAIVAAEEKRPESPRDIASDRMQEWLENYHRAYGKIRDPYHPWFNPDQFRFEDYISHCMMKEVLAKLFPVGTPKVFVDRILVDSAGAHANPSTHHANKVNYLYDLRPGPLVLMTETWNLSFQFNELWAVQDIHLPIGKPPGESVYDFFESCKFGKQYGKTWE